MVQELRETLAEAAALVADLGVRFKSGDAAGESITRLQALVATLTAAPDLPDDLRPQLDQLLDAVRQTLAAGDEWLARAGPELETQQLRRRVQKTYGVT